MSDREGAKDLPMRALQLFVAVCRESSFKKAANRFGVTTSAVSYQIRILEKWTGASLFDRSTRNPELTPLGKALFEGIHTAFDMIDQIAVGVKHATGTASVSISAPPAIAAQRLISMSEKLLKGEDNLRIDLRLAQFDAPIGDDAADIAIRFLHQNPGGLSLGLPGWSAVLTPSLSERLGGPAHISELRDAVLLHEDIYNHWPSVFKRSNCEVPPDIRYVSFGDATSVLSATLASAGVALLPKEITRRLWRKGVLVSIGGGNVSPEEGYYAVPAGVSYLKPEAEKLLIELDNYFN